jgi:Protein of unknown function (DUF2384)
MDGVARERLICEAERRLGDSRAAHLFLTVPHPRLGGMTPLEAAASREGERRVRELLAGAAPVPA